MKTVLACAREMQQINYCKKTINFNVIFFVHVKKVSIQAPESGHHSNSACQAQWACRPRKHDSVSENYPIQNVNCIKYTLNASVTIKKMSANCACEQFHMFRI